MLDLNYWNFSLLFIFAINLCYLFSFSCSVFYTKCALFSFFTFQHMLCGVFWFLYNVHFVSIIPYTAAFSWHVCSFTLITSFIVSLSDSCISFFPIYSLLLLWHLSYYSFCALLFLLLTLLIFLSPVFFMWTCSHSSHVLFSLLFLVLSVVLLRSWCSGLVAPSIIKPMHDVDTEHRF